MDRCLVVFAATRGAAEPSDGIITTRDGRLIRRPLIPARDGDSK
jgi:hypothetical protein